MTGPIDTPQTAVAGVGAAPPCCGEPRPDLVAGHAVAAPSAAARYTIRPAAPGDADAVRALLAASALPVEGLDEQFGAQYAVAVSDAGEIVGAEGYEVYGPWGLLRSAAVDASWRGRGIGAALTRDRIAAARAQGLRGLYGLTTTAADYFPRLGFAIVGRDAVPAEVRASREFASICPSSATTLEMRFDASE